MALHRVTVRLDADLAPKGNPPAESHTGQLADSRIWVQVLPRCSPPSEVYAGRTGKEDAGPTAPAPTPMLESGLEPEPAPAPPTTWAIRRPDEDEREAEALL